MKAKQISWFLTLASTQGADHSDIWEKSDYEELVPKNTYSSKSLSELSTLALNSIKSEIETLIDDGNILGCSLSGGMDSTSLAYVTQHALGKPINVYSMKGERRENRSDVTYIDRALESGFFIPNDIEERDLDIANDYWESFKILGFPHRFVNIGWFKRVWQQAEKDGCKVFIEGIGGDLVFPYGYDGFNLNVQKLQLVELYKRIKMAKGNDVVAYNAINGFVLKSLAKRLMGPRLASLFNKGEDYAYLRDQDLAKRLVHRDFKMQQLSGRELHRQQLIMSINAMEHTLDEIAAPYTNMKIVCPFVNKELIKIVLSIDDKIREQARPPRYLYKEVFGGIVPDVFLTRKDKGKYKQLIDKTFDRKPLPIHEKLAEVVIPEKVDYRKPSARNINVMNHFLWMKYG